MIIEVPCGNIESAEEAAKGGAERIELCGALPLGGLTPSPGMYRAISHLPVLKFVMIRPREGDFVYSSSEFNSMLQDIEYFRRAGADGIVSGILEKNGTIDKDRCKDLVAAAYPLPFTFHRAFDLSPDPFQAFETLIELKVSRLLTSGQSENAFKGKELIAELVNLSGNKISVMAGAGINEKNVVEICRSTGVKEIHLSGKILKQNIKYPTANKIKMGTGEGETNSFYVTDKNIIKQVRELLKGID
jgi:copper homeostasis protein